MTSKRPSTQPPIREDGRTGPTTRSRIRAERSTLEQQAFPVSIPRAPEVPAEIDRVRLIAELSCILRDPSVPQQTRVAGLTLVGWLARRMPGEPAHALGCEDTEVTLVRSRAR
jgi:hypothetical protein